MIQVQLRKPFFPQKSILTIQKKIAKAIKNGRLTLGNNLEEFEKDFAKYLGVKYVCGVSSGTAGLHLSLLGLDIKSGDEVIVPSKTFISTANAAVYCNAKPIFCDVDEYTFQMDPKKLEKLITKKTKAVIPVHLGGNVCDMNEILEIGKKYNVSIIEDAAHAHGSTYNKKKAGTFGTMGVFSLYPDKIMASSDGGIMVTNSNSLYEKIMLLRNVGRKNLGKYDFSAIGYNYRMNEIQAILAIEQLRLLPDMIKRRREIAFAYDSAFKNMKKLEIQKIYPNIKSSYYAYILRLTKGNLGNFRKKLSEKKIETSPMFTSLHKMKIYQKMYGKIINTCPVSEMLDTQTFTIPLHPGMSNGQVNYV
ncbi:MAG: hypothetical protein CO032_03555, partial [Nitrosopumilales archaeon CG_4_9_14_0_2_um_filter_34_16]